MFNFEWSNKTLFYGIYARINSFWENSYLKAEGAPSEGELTYLRPLADKLPAGVIDGEAVMAPTSSERQLDRRNLRRASALLTRPAGRSAMTACGATLPGRHCRLKS